ncbi:MAG: polyprenyl diphosphate synthase [Nitrosomonadaceae bacterium]|nr:polyprenyl diphosphate synthase [Nitrosomonadaceae bacterium]MDW7665695.1 polyprenyl diphosphate synthase [Nitrosomonadaceae bacterium]
MSETTKIPQHVAIIMDGNGRWANNLSIPRISGHKRGVEVVRIVVKSCIEQGVKYLTLFAFSSENWSRPLNEITLLIALFTITLEQEIIKLHKNNIRFKVIGDLSKFSPKIIKLIHDGETLTAANTGLTLTIAANYGGRWDIIQATLKMLEQRPELIGHFEEKDLAQHFMMSYAPEPDLLIRTGGEQRISNFLLWNLIYTELYFTDTLWPDFKEDAFNLAIESYFKRERRFGKINAPVKLSITDVTQKISKKMG